LIRCESAPGIDDFPRPSSVSSSLRTYWRAAPDGALEWRQWGEEVVVFNEKTGSTHLLGAFPGEVFRRLLAAESGATPDELANGLTERSRSAVTTGLAGAVAEVLSDFARLGLAQPDES
jgi:PqqD family protein of HPr-rel-A system